jgi:hypothetical protein
LRRPPSKSPNSQWIIVLQIPQCMQENHTLS